MNLQNKFMFIIPAKGNSQRIKNKNLKKLNGLPLVEYTLSFLKKNQIHKNIYLSTENSKIKKISKKYNINIIDRPKKLCGKHTSTEAVVLDLLNRIDFKAKGFEWIITLQPTSPFRKISTLKKCLRYTKNKSFDVITTFKKNKGDFWINNNNKIKRIFPSWPRNQHQRNNLYEETSSIYINRISQLFKTKSMISGNVKLVLTNNEENIDINTLEDFDYSEYLLKTKKY
jgi:CMP-N,N'-diacetyllegionaminic acid synthase|tara:strand:- start:577 stop:1260 length:684 start_codon:yes stop_codon:yes gene_type:complete